jgi:hypothetical protein
VADFKIDSVVDHFKNVSSLNSEEWENWLVNNKILK